MKRIRSGFGLGDNLYLQPIVKYYVNKGYKLQVCSKYPQLFSPYKVSLAPFSKMKIDILAHYTHGKHKPGTSQFDDMCFQAKIPTVELKLDWSNFTNKILDEIKNAAKGRKILCVQAPSVPFGRGRTDGFGRSLAPDFTLMNVILSSLRDKFLVVQIGNTESDFKLTGIDLCYSNRTSIPDLMTIASASDYFLAQTGYSIPLSEGFSKPNLILWSSKGLADPHPFVRSITPEKVLHKKSSNFVIDNWEHERILEKAKEVFV